MLKKFFKKNKKVDYIIYKGLNLPYVRSNEKLNSEEAYLKSCEEQINYLKKQKLINDTTVLLDFGSGQGRLINGLIYTKTRINNYIGIDTNKKSVDWCNKYLNYNDAIKFLHIPSYNARYNKNAVGLKSLPFDNEKFNLIFLNSVFSHMISKDVVFYLKEFYKYLKPSGSIYLTAFVEENVKNEEENPENYLSISSGALHRVRYEKKYFFKLITDSGFDILKFEHQYIDRTKQSVIVIKKTINDT